MICINKVFIKTWSIVAMAYFNYVTKYAECPNCMNYRIVFKKYENDSNKTN